MPRSGGGVEVLAAHKVNVIKSRPSLVSPARLLFKARLVSLNSTKLFSSQQETSLCSP